jgi:N-carbamoylputrescine amidase
MRVTVAATQMACGWERDENIEKAARLIRAAAEAGANVVLPQEMFSTHFYAFMDWKPEHFAHAETLEGPTVRAMQDLARDLGVVIPTNFFERANNAYFNTLAMIDADGRVLGIYRKAHIPVGPPGCFEKVYTSPGDTGFRVWRTGFGVLGAGICWDQWFPEAARIMSLMGAEILLYPSGIGSDCHDHWQVVMQGHAGANLTPLVCSNRVGTEQGDMGVTTFWGRAFVAGPRGEIAAKADATSETFVTARFDLDEVRALRDYWGVFRDRRPDAYGPLMTLAGPDEAPPARSRIIPALSPRPSAAPSASLGSGA